MTILRRRFHIGWLALLGLLVVWFVGVGLFFFGGSAVFYYEEPSQFVPNLGFALGICIIPGGLLILLSLGVYAFLAWRRRQAHPKFGSPSPFPVDEADFIQTLKAQEKTD